MMSLGSIWIWPISPAQAPVTSAGQVAMVDKCRERHQLRAEQLRAAAVMSERHESVEGVEIALNGAEIGLQRPEGGDNRSRHAEFLLGSREDVGVFLQVRRALASAGNR